MQNPSASIGDVLGEIEKMAADVGANPSTPVSFLFDAIPASKRATILASAMSISTRPEERIEFITEQVKSLRSWIILRVWHWWPKKPSACPFGMQFTRSIKTTRRILDGRRWWKIWLTKCQAASPALTQTVVALQFRLYHLCAHPLTKAFVKSSKSYFEILQKFFQNFARAIAKSCKSLKKKKRAISVFCKSYFSVQQGWSKPHCASSCKKSVVFLRRCIITSNLQHLQQDTSAHHRLAGW